MTDSRDRLIDAYTNTPPRTIDRSPFLVDQKLERLLVIRDTDPRTWAVFGPETQMALAYYEAARTAAGYTGPTEETTDDDRS